MRIYTPDGERRWGDLKHGDSVFAPDGTATRIVAVYPRGVLPMFRVTFDDGASTRCCGEHLWKVRGRTERRYFKMDAEKPMTGRSLTYSRNNRVVKDLTPDGYSVLSTEQIVERNRSGDGRRRQFEIPMHGPVTFRCGNGEGLDPYVLGVWLGDGSKRSGRGSWRDAEIDAEIVDRGYEVRRSLNGKEVTVLGLAGHLRALGLLVLGSPERYVPENYRTASPKRRREILGGLMDTDGCIGKDSSMEFDSTSRRLAEDVVWLARSLGGNAHIGSVKKTWYKDKAGNRVACLDCYRVSLALPFNPFRVGHKSARWKKPQDRYLTRYISEIVSDGAEDAMCIEVEHESACYLTNDFIVTHNSTVLAWMGWNFLSCYGEKGEHPKGAAVSITGDSLRDTLWPEFSKWQQRSPFLSSEFTWTKERIFSKRFPSTWFISARTWSKTATAEEQGRTLSGLHSKWVLALLDESGDIPTTVLKAAEQALTACKWGKIVQAGNPTSHDGMLYAASTELADQWSVICITGDPDDPNRSPRIDIEWAREQIKAHGRENPWVMAYILGKFPPTSLNTLLGPEQIREACARKYKDDVYSMVARRIGIDVARFGDNRTVLFPRQGLRAFNPVVMRGAKTTEIAARVIVGKTKFQSEEEFIDDTGGWAAGVIDQAALAGYSLTPINFSGRAIDPRYFNRRSEMYFKAAEWVKKGGWLPKAFETDLLKEGSAPTYWFENGRLRVEEKEQVKKRLSGMSPDIWDALCLSFSLPDRPKSLAAIHPAMGGRGNHLSDYQPLERE